MSDDFADYNPYRPVEVFDTLEESSPRTYLVPLPAAPDLFVDRAGNVLRRLELTELVSRVQQQAPQESPIQGPVIYFQRLEELDHFNRYVAAQCEPLDPTRKREPIQMRELRGITLMPTQDLDELAFEPAQPDLAQNAQRFAGSYTKRTGAFTVSLRDGGVHVLPRDAQRNVYSFVDSVEERGPAHQRYGVLLPLLAQQADRVCREQGLDDEHRAPMVRAMDYEGKSRTTVLFREDLQEILLTIERGLGKEYAMQAHDRNGPALAYAAKSASPAGR